MTQNQHPGRYGTCDTPRSSRSAFVGVRGATNKRAVPTVSVTSLPRPSGSVDSSMSTIRSVSNRPSSMRVSRALLRVWSYKLSFHDALCVQPCKTIRNPQSYGEQATSPLKRNGVSILALDLRFLTQSKLVTSLQQTAGRNQRLAHIRDLPGVVHGATSACLDSEPSLRIVFDV